MSNFYYGNEVSNYGKENNRVDYATFAKAFSHVLNNDIMSELTAAGFYFEPVTGSDYYFEDSNGNIYSESEKDEKIEELEALQYDLDTDIEEQNNKYDEIQDEIDCLNEEHYNDYYQYYIVPEYAVDILEENNELVYYCEKLDLYIWCVDHWGTSWDYVLTSIKLEPEKDEFNAALKAAIGE